MGHCLVPSLPCEPKFELHSSFMYTATQVKSVLGVWVGDGYIISVMLLNGLNSQTH